MAGNSLTQYRTNTNCISYTAPHILPRYYYNLSNFNRFIWMAILSFIICIRSIFLLIVLFHWTLPFHCIKHTYNLMLWLNLSSLAISYLQVRMLVIFSKSNAALTFHSWGFISHWGIQHCSTSHSTWEDEGTLWEGSIPQVQTTFISEILQIPVCKA